MDFYVNRQFNGKLTISKYLYRKILQKNNLYQEIRLNIYMYVQISLEWWHYDIDHLFDLERIFFAYEEAILKMRIKFIILQ